jgi:hypothetical protein
LYVVLPVPEYHTASDKEEVSISDLVDDPWIIFNKRVHPLLYDAILQQATAHRIVQMTSITSSPQRKESTLFWKMQALHSCQNRLRSVVNESASQSSHL